MRGVRTVHRVVLLVGLVVLLDVAALVIAFTRHASGDERVADRAPVAPAGVRSLPPPPLATAGLSRDPSRVDSAVEPSAMGFDPDGLQVRRFERVSRALELLRYPPDSQPLRREMTDVLRPGARYETPQPVTEELALLFTANTYAIGAGTTVLATLEVLRGKGDEERKPVPLQVLACNLARFAQPDYLPVASSLPLNDDGQGGDAAAGDGVYSLSFAPSAWPELATHNGLIRLDVSFVMEGQGAPVRASLDFRMTGIAPATFLGVANEQITADGLSITVLVDVRRAGRYFVQGLVFDSGENPVGVAVARPSLEAGRARVSLLYWGLLFHEAHAVAPFTFRTLTGHRLPDDGEPERSDVATWEGSYRTRVYSPGSFSDKEHESAAKSLKIQALSDLAARDPARAQAAAGK